MKLKDLLSGFSYKIEKGREDIEVTELVFDSRKLVPGAVFVCISGAVYDGHEFATAAVEAGAVAIIAEREVEEIGRASCRERV